MDKRKLTAPCGIDCFNCEVYEGNITEKMQNYLAGLLKKNPEEIPCKGCRAEEGCISVIAPVECKTYPCVMEKGVEFCFECDEFPCTKLQPAKEGAEKFPHNFKLFNLCRMKTVGFEKWAEEESLSIRKRYFMGKFIPGTGPVLEDE